MRPVEWLIYIEKSIQFCSQLMYVCGCIWHAANDNNDVHMIQPDTLRAWKWMNKVYCATFAWVDVRIS